VPRRPKTGQIKGSEERSESAAGMAHRRRPLRSRESAPLILAAAAVTLGLSACGGGSPSSGAHMGTTASSASTVPTAPTATTEPQPSSLGSSSSSGSSGGSGSSSALEYSKCMRVHRVTNFPDPDANGFIPKLAADSGIDVHSQTFRAAQTACEKYTPGATMTPAQSEQRETDLLRFAQCMRSHGLPNFPGPSLNPGGLWAFGINRSSGVDRGSPIFQAADNACKSLMQDLPGPTGGSGG
jgi:hypothetical protein